MSAERSSKKARAPKAKRSSPSNQTFQPHIALRRIEQLHRMIIGRLDVHDRLMNEVRHLACDTRYYLRSEKRVLQVDRGLMNLPLRFGKEALDRVVESIACLQWIRRQRGLLTPRYSSVSDPTVHGLAIKVFKHVTKQWDDAASDFADYGIRAYQLGLRSFCERWAAGAGAQTDVLRHALINELDMAIKALDPPHEPKTSDGNATQSTTAPATSPSREEKLPLSVVVNVNNTVTSHQSARQPAASNCERSNSKARRRSRSAVQEGAPTPKLDVKELTGTVAAPLSADHALSTKDESDRSKNRWCFHAASKKWEVQFAGERSEFRDLVGMRHIAELIRRSPKEVPVTDLVAPDAKGRAVAEQYDDAPLDDAAIRDLKKRIAEIDAELEDEKLHGRAESFALRSERDQIYESLMTCATKANRRRSRAQDGMRTRVTNAIHYALERLRPKLPQAYAHLAAHIDTGNNLCYRPSQPTPWDLLL